MINKENLYKEIRDNKQYQQIYNCTACGACVADAPKLEKCSLRTKYKGQEANAKGLLWTLQDILENKIEFSTDIIELLFRCTTCNYCQAYCPMLEPMTIIELLRKEIVDIGIIPQTIKRVLEDVLKYGNVWGKTQKDRANWSEGLNIKHISEIEDFDFLLFLDCSSAYIERNQKIARELALILNKAEVKYGYLGAEEKCDGNEILKIGEDGLFEKLAEENIANFKKYRVKNIVTISPHSFHVFKNQYNKVDSELDIKIIHYSQLLKELINKKKLKLNKLNQKVTYHDPCYLGRHNAIWEEPREILRNILEPDLTEMNYNRKKSVCCGGGGGCLWMERGKGVVMEQIRLKQALELHVDVIACACPFCIQQFESAREELNAQVQVKDVVELVYEAIGNS